MSIEGSEDFGFELVCDVCGETVDEFDDFHEAVEWKKDRSNGWKSKYSKKEGWRDLCHECSKVTI